MSPAQSQAAFCRERRRTSGGRTLHKPGPREPSSTASQHLLSPAQNPDMEPIDRVWVGHNRNGPGYQRRPPIKPEAQKREADRAAKNKGHEFDGPENRSLSERCIMWPHEGPPMLPIPVNVNYLQVVQGPGYVSILQEMIHDVRIIPTDGRRHLPPGIRLWQGDSLGHWEGNTLVVDVTNFSGRAAFFFGGIRIGLLKPKAAMLAAICATWSSEWVRGFRAYGISFSSGQSSICLAPIAAPRLVQGAARVREALFREYWPLREHFCCPRQPKGRRSSKSNSFGSPNRTRTRNLLVNASCGVF